VARRAHETVGTRGLNVFLELPRPLIRRGDFGANVLEDIISYGVLHVVDDQQWVQERHL
jgi:hypothetical protein